MECLSCARHHSKYFIQIWPSQNSYKIGNSIAIFNIRKLRRRRVKHHSWSHTARKWQNSDSTPAAWPWARTPITPDGAPLPIASFHSVWGTQCRSARDSSNTETLPALQISESLLQRQSVLTWIPSLLAHSTDFGLAGPRNGMSQLSILEINLSR